MLALERDAAEQPDIDRFLASAGTKADLRALLTSGEWQSPQQDGRSSAAMLGLLDLVRQWRRAGSAVPVVALRGQLGHFDDPKQLQVALDRSMADGVTAALHAHAGHTVIVLAGSFHTAVGSKMHEDIIRGPSMGDELASRGPVHVIGLFSSVGGAVWKWVARAPAPAVADEGAGPFDLHDARIDSRVDLGPLTASRPARERLD